MGSGFAIAVLAAMLRRGVLTGIGIAGVGFATGLLT
jgi:hypothetical protein